VGPTGEVGVLSSDRDDLVADDVPVRQLQAPYGAARLAATLDRRARVEQALTVDPHDVDRFVAVPEHHQPGMWEPPVRPALPAGPGPAVVHHPDAHAGQLELQPVGEGADQGGVVVPQYRVHRSATPERGEQVTGDDVAGVEDHVSVLHVVPHVAREFREIAPKVGVGEDEGAEWADPRIMSDSNPSL
jgi:hypothetical protein